MEDKHNSYYNIFIILLIALLSFGTFYFLNLYKSTEKLNNELINQNNKLVSENGSLVEELAKSKKDYMELSTNQKNQTIVEYIEKESPNDADVEINQGQPKVIVSIGDDKLEYVPEINSSSKIENGKLVVTTDNILNLDIEKIVDARFKDKIESMEAKHQLELENKNKELEKINAVLKRTRKQRDLYASVSLIEGGLMVVKSF